MERTLESLLPRWSPKPVGSLSNPNSSPQTLPLTHRCFSHSASPCQPHHQKAGQGRVKYPSNPQQGPLHRLGNNGAISLYLTFAPTAFMTYSSPPQPAAIQPSISHPLPEWSWPFPNALPASQASVLPPFSPSFLMSPRFLSVLFPIPLYFLLPLSTSSCSPNQLPFSSPFPSFLPFLSFLLLSSVLSFSP